MKLLKIKTITTELDNYGASAGYKALVLNNVSHYNELVEDHLVKANRTQDYMMYQLSVQISKLLLNLKVAYDKLQAKTPSPDEPDEFELMMQEIRPKR